MCATTVYGTADRNDGNEILEDDSQEKLELGNWSWISSSRLTGLTLTRNHQPPYTSRKFLLDSFCFPKLYTNTPITLDISYIQRISSGNP